MIIASGYDRPDPVFLHLYDPSSHLTSSKQRPFEISAAAKHRTTNILTLRAFSYEEIDSYSCKYIHEIMYWILT
jgi:hypothetical protein